jgi:predicted house-cleaning NTP pyrophosphatase (Maf/HAM1 superfamily)
VLTVFQGDIAYSNLTRAFRLSGDPQYEMTASSDMRHLSGDAHQLATAGGFLMEALLFCHIKFATVKLRSESYDTCCR